MSERTTDQKSLQISCCLTTTLLDSSKIFLSNPQIFLSIFTLTTLPLSLLLITLSLSSHPIQSHINHLQSTALYSSTRFEARHVWQESRAGAVSLLKTKALFFIPSYLLSLLAVVTAVNSAALAYHGKRPSFQTAVKAVKDTWKRPFVTSLCVYAVVLSFSAVIRTCLAVTVPSAAVSTVLVAAVGAITEVYFMSVLSLGLVVSVMEDRFGFDAIRVGSRIMQGRRFNGWILSGLFVLMTGGIGLELDQDLFGKSYWSTTSTVMMVIMGFGENVGLMAAAASNKSASRKDVRYPEIVEDALQFVLDSCESSISKYSKFLQASRSMDLNVTSPKQLNCTVFLKQLAVDLCTTERRTVFCVQYIPAIGVWMWRDQRRHLQKAIKEQEHEKTNHDEDEDEDSKTESVLMHNQKKTLKPDNKLHFSTGSSKHSTSSEPDPGSNKTIFQFESSKEIQVQNDNGATATLETETEFSRDARAIRERALKQAGEGSKEKNKVSGDEKLYKGIHGYTDYKAGFRREQTIASEKAGGAHGPLRASAHIRVSAWFDCQPDICKDYKETGYCGYGDSCKFMHDRGDYKSGWQMEKEWDEAEKARKRKLALGGDSMDEGGADQSDEDDDENALPFACFICRQPFADPVVTKCKHYFCEHCALRHHSKNKKCFVCNQPTLGIFNTAHEIRKKMAAEGK